MINATKMFRELQAATLTHNKLAAVFDAFANHVNTAAKNKVPGLEGLTCEMALVDRRFNLTCAGKTVTFVFDSHIPAEAGRVGRVTCYRSSDFANPTLTKVGFFTFGTRGGTNLKDEQGQDEYSIDTESASLIVALHFLHKCLAY